MVRCYGLSDVGLVRATNQDRLLIDEAQGAFLVADGVGGLGRGEEAAETAISVCHHYLQATRMRDDASWPFGFEVELGIDANRLVTALKLANRQLQRRVEESADRSGMGTTLVGLLVQGRRATVANVGDSRAYLWRNQELEQLTVDDKWVAQMIRNGTLTEEEAKHHPMRNVLTQSIGTQSKVEVHTREFELQEGDQILLSTDGVHEVAGHERLMAMFRQGLQPEPSIRELVKTVLSLGAPDNTTALLVQFEALA